MTKKYRSNKMHTQWLCQVVSSAFLSYPKESQVVDVGGGMSVSFSPKLMTICLNNNEILSVTIDSGKPQRISVFDGGHYDYLGCCSRLTIERLNGLFDLFERLDVLPPLRVFLDSAKSSTLIGYRDYQIPFGRTGFKCVTFKCHTKNIEVLELVSNGGPSVPPAHATKARKSVQRITNKAVRNQHALFKSLLDDGRRKECVLCNAPSSVVEAAHIVPFSESGADHGGNGLFLCKNHHHLFDNHSFTIRPTDFSVVCVPGYDRASLGITKNNSASGVKGPSRWALSWRWDVFTSKLSGSFVLAMPLCDCLEHENNS